MAIVNSRAAIEPKTGKAAIFVNETIHSLIRKLFANGEQGFTRTPYDLSTMFQDATGTIPVTGTGQPVGLVLDKSKGLVIGNELIPDYNFDTDTTAINFIVRGTKTYLSASKSAKVTTTSLSGAIGLAFSPVDPLFVTSGTYKVEIKLNEYSVANTNARLTVKKSSEQNSNVNPSQVITCNGIGVFSGYLHVNAGDTLTIIEEVASTVGDFFTIDYISAKLISGNHAYQTTSAARPVFGQKPILGSELVVNGTFDTNLIGWQNITNSFAWANGAAVSTGTQGDMAQDNLCAVGKTYLMSFNISGAGGAGVYVSVAGNDIAHYKNGSFTIITTATSTLKSIRFRIFSGNAATIDNVSLKEVTGYRTDQNYIEYDGVDDKLITNLPTQLTGCTVIRSVPNVGTQILTGQTIPTTYNDSTDYCGLIVINRALTATETAQITKLFNKAAGV